MPGQQSLSKPSLRAAARCISVPQCIHGQTTATHSLLQTAQVRPQANELLVRSFSELHGRCHLVVRHLQLADGQTNKFHRLIGHSIRLHRRRCLLIETCTCCRLGFLQPYNSCRNVSLAVARSRLTSRRRTPQSTSTGERRSFLTSHLCSYQNRPFL